MKAQPFQPTPPSLIMSDEKNGTRVTFFLYGPHDSERRKDAVNELRHRLNQLTPEPKKEPKFFVDNLGFAHRVREEDEQ